MDAGTVINAGVTKLCQWTQCDVVNRIVAAAASAAVAAVVAVVVVVVSHKKKANLAHEGSLTTTAATTRRKEAKRQSCGKSIKYINLPRNVHGKRIKKLCCPAPCGATQLNGKYRKC